MDSSHTTNHSFIDFDNDGDLDVYLGNNDNNLTFDPVLANDFLYRNDGNGTYTGPASVFQDSTETLIGVWGDYDNDGYMDLFINTIPFTITVGITRLFHNNGDGTFTHIVSGPPASEASSGWSASWVDYDNDMDLDIFVRNAFGVPSQLYRNDGNGVFTKITDAGGISSLQHNNGGVAWGDYDNDGDLDVYMSAFTTGNLLYKNNGNGTFTRDSTEIISNDIIVESYGAAWADYDNDGDLDLYVSNAFGTGESFLYRNNGGSSHWLDVKCKGTVSNKEAIGARVFVKAIISGQPRWQMREINTNLSATWGGIGPRNQHFGLGDATVIDSLKIVWPASGITQVFTNVSPDRFIEITEGVNVIANAIPCRPDLPPTNPAVITGKVFSDTDNDCAFNSSNDFPVANRIMQATPGPDFVFSNNSGDYQFRLNGGTYNVTQATISNDIWNLQDCQPNSAYTVSVNNGDTAVGKNFSLNAVSAPICSATVDITSIPGIIPCPTGFLSTPCPGFQWKYCVKVTNTGINSPILAGSTLQIVLDPNMSYAGIIESNSCGLTGPVIVGNTLTLTVPNAAVLGANGSSCNICFDVLAAPPPSAPLSYCTSATFNAQCANGNNTPTNQQCDPATCSCDPNDKLVAPKGCGPFRNVSKTQPLTYTVRFQNTGTGPAHDIVIRDVIDSDLEITTLQILASSHSITHVEIIPDNTLIISYEGINLPDSGSNLQGSKGFVTFSIKPKTNLPNGTQITNQAGIYFDFNEVVLTNTTLNTLRDIPEPIADFTAKHSCTSTGLVYDFTYTGGTADNAIFLWSFGTSATPSTSTSQNPTGILFSTTGTKQVTLTVTRFGCTASVIKNVEVVSVMSGNKITICHKGKTIAVSQSALPAHLAHGDCIGTCGTSTARLAGNNQSEIILMSGEENSVEIYPNPAAETINLNYTIIGDVQSASINIYDAMGRKIKSFAVDKGAHSYVLNTSSLTKGFYFVMLITDNEIIAKNKLFIIK